MVGKENIAPTLQEHRKALIDTLFSQCYPLIKEKKFNELSKWHRKIIIINPSDPELYFRIAEDFRRQGVYDPAIEYYNEALKLNDKYAQAYYGRALCYFKLGELNNALPDAEKANFYCHDDKQFIQQVRDLYADLLNNKMLTEDNDYALNYRK